MINNFELYCENYDNEKRLNWIIDKISKLGKSSLTKDEKDFLDNYSDIKPPVNTNKYEHYNKYIISLMSDIKNNNITENIAKKFIEKHINKEDLFDFLLSLLKDGKLDFLTNIHNIKDSE